MADANRHGIPGLCHFRTTFFGLHHVKMITLWPGAANAAMQDREYILRRIPVLDVFVGARGLKMARGVEREVSDDPFQFKDPKHDEAHHEIASDPVPPGPLDRDRGQIHGVARDRSDGITEGKPASSGAVAIACRR